MSQFFDIFVTAAKLDLKFYLKVNLKGFSQ